LSKPVIEQKLKAVDAMRQKDYATAERLTRNRLTQSHRDPQALMEYGTIALLAQQWSNAADFCQTSLSVWPDYADGHFCLGGALLGQDRIDDGIQQMREVIKTKPTYMEAYLNLAEAYERQSKRTAALAALTALRELAPTYNLPAPLNSLIGK
jgi:predicted Zn-dependent protease